MQKSLITSLTTLSNITYHFWTMNQVIVLLLFSMIFIFDVLIFVSLRKRSFSCISRLFIIRPLFSFLFMLSSQDSIGVTLSKVSR